MDEFVIRFSADIAILKDKKTPNGRKPSPFRSARISDFSQPTVYNMSINEERHLLPLPISLPSFPKFSRREQSPNRNR